MPSAAIRTPPNATSWTCTSPANTSSTRPGPLPGRFFAPSRRARRPSARHPPTISTTRPDLEARHRAPGPRAPGELGVQRMPGPRFVVRRSRYPCCTAVSWETHTRAYRGLEVLARAALAPCARRMRHGPAGGPDGPGPSDIGSDRPDRSELAARPDRRPTPGGPRARAMFFTNNHQKFDMTSRGDILMLNVPYVSRETMF